MKLPNLPILSTEEITRINDTSLEILRTIGVKIESSAAKQLLLEHGASTDDKTGRMLLPPSLVEDGVKKAPSSFLICGSDGTNTVDINLDSQVFATQGSPTRIYDPDSPRMPRNATLADLTKYYFNPVDFLDAQWNEG